MDQGVQILRGTKYSVTGQSLTPYHGNPQPSTAGTFNLSYMVLTYNVFTVKGNTSQPYTKNRMQGMKKSFA